MGILLLPEGKSVKGRQARSAVLGAKVFGAGFTKFFSSPCSFSAPYLRILDDFWCCCAFSGEKVFVRVVHSYPRFPCQAGAVILLFCLLLAAFVESRPTVLWSCTLSQSAGSHLMACWEGKHGWGEGKKKSKAVHREYSSEVRVIDGKNQRLKGGWGTVTEKKKQLICRCVRGVIENGSFGRLFQRGRYTSFPWHS